MRGRFNRNARSTVGIGAEAESLVAEHLRDRGFEIVARNVRVGPREIDLIARRGDLLVFCEVRARTRSDFVSPLATIDAAKIARIREAAKIWLHTQRWRGAVRFDAASVILSTRELDYIENAF
jgi:putative endonuclease